MAVDQVNTQRSNGPTIQRSKGSHSSELDESRSNKLVGPHFTQFARMVRLGLLDRWIVGSLDRWTVGPLDRWTVGSLSLSCLQRSNRLEPRLGSQGVDVGVATNACGGQRRQLRRDAFQRVEGALAIAAERVHARDVVPGERV